MQPIVGRIEQLTTRPSPPTGGSGVPNKMPDKIVIPIELDTTKLDIALAKAEKLKAILSELQGRIGTATPE